MKTEAHILTSIEGWFAAHEAKLALESDEEQTALPERWASLDEWMRAAGISADEFRPMAHCNGSSSGCPDDATAARLGRAVGVCFARAPSTRLLDAAGRILDSRAGWGAFSIAASEHLKSNPLGLTMLETCLAGLVHAFTWAPRKIVYAHRENMCALVENFRQLPRLNDVWPGGHSRVILVRYEAAFDTLRLCDAHAFLRLLDLFPHPEPGRYILTYASLRINYGERLGLLALARPCFEAGVWRPQVKSPVLVLAAIEESLEALADDEGESGSAPSTTFAAAVTKVIETVLHRQDGNDLGHAWLQRLMHRRAFRKGQRAANGRCTPQHQYLLLELASALSLKDGVVEWIRDEQEILRRDRSVVALSAAGLGKSGGQAAVATLMREVLKLGLWTTGQNDGFSASSNAERLLVAALVGRQPDPAACFEELWRSMAPVRDRAGHEMISAGGHAGDATIIAVTWFLFGLDAIDPRTSAHRTLWRALLRAIQECALVQVSPLAQPEWTARYQFLAAHLASRLVTGVDGATDDLRELLEPLLCLEMRLAEVLATFFDAGVASNTITDALGQRGELAALLRRLGSEQVWRETRQKQQLGQQSRFSLTIERMVEAIEG